MKDLEWRIEDLILEVVELQSCLLDALLAAFPSIAHSTSRAWPRNVDLNVRGVAWHGVLHGMGYRFEAEDGRVIEAHDRIQEPPFPVDGYRIAVYASSCGVRAIVFSDLPAVTPEPEEVGRLLPLLERAGFVARDVRVESFRPPRYLIVGAT